jgi:archaellum component FlaC
MPTEEENVSSISALFGEFSRRLTDMEENFRMLKDRLLAVSKTMLSHTEKVNKDVLALREEVREIRNELDRLRETVEHVVAESSEFARREELKMIERYAKVFEPLHYTTEEDVRRIIKEEK